jgi:hypothetical protein
MEEAERAQEELRKERDRSMADSPQDSRAEPRQNSREIPLTSPFFVRSIISISFN